MAFWGVELEPGKPYTHKYDSSLGRLRITQAILGCRVVSTVDNVIVQCKVGKKSPIKVCLLCPANGDTCTLDIQFEEKEDDVVLENLGNRSVHLSGHYIRNNGQSGNEDGGSNGAFQDALEEKTVHVVEHKDNGSAKNGKDPEVLEYKDVIVNGLVVRTMDSGLVIEDLELGQDRSNRTAAYDRCWVNIYFIGRVKRNDYVIESIFGKPTPTRYQLGVGELIRGLDVGINGMHIGDRRKITVPPSMGYKSRQGVPHDSWLEFEVKLENVTHSA
ncbi:hypothetical protein MKW92_010257 [Papaver armeniacum]|nr:hypothetical protein MKW92_010257 [Papaver armeniacum]